MSRDIFFIFLLLFVCVVTVECKTCQSMDIRNSPKGLEKLRNCTEIVGFLKILLMDKVKSESEFDDYVFPKLTRITGYLFFYNVRKLTSVARLFPNLMVIRGYELFTDYSLVLHAMPDLREVGTNRLLYIARGLVKIDQCPRLCYANTIDWEVIGSKLHYVPLLGSHDARGKCEPCPRECNGYCWNAATCQERYTNCHRECLGCLEPNSATQCYTCKNFEYHGNCVADCPSNQTKKIYRHRTSYKCVTETECRSLLRGTWWVFDGECINDCPVGYEQTLDKNNKITCRYCGQNCTKWCRVTEPIENMDKLQKLKGCTNINGSLAIRLSGVDISTQNLLVAEFDESLGSVKYIKDTLVVAWTQTIKSLSFLKNLRVIAGENLGKDNNAVFFYENQNLQKLWDFEDSNFTLKLERGGIGFHYNPQLCDSEIMKLVNLTKASNYSLNYNGDRSVCNYVDFPIKVVVNITNASLSWEPVPLINNDSYIGFTVYYIEHEEGNITEYAEGCDVRGWKSWFVRDNSTMLLNLLPYTRYAFYIKIYRRLLEGGRSVFHYFKTLPDDPEVPIIFTVVSPDPNTLKLLWLRPRESHGLLKYYKYDFDMEPDRDIQLERDYCAHPRTVEGEAADQEWEKPEVRQPALNKTSANNSCACADSLFQEDIPERSILLQDRYLPLCDVQAQSKYAKDPCKHLMYKPIGDVDKSDDIFQIDKRAGSVKKSRPYPINNTIDANLSEWKIGNLRHYTMYVIYFSACNEGDKCSPVLQTSARTLKKEDADDIETVTVSKVENANVVVTWSEPKYPNSVIVSYHVEFQKMDLAHSKPTVDCVARNENFPGPTLPLYNLLPGEYAVRVQAISLAGPGRFSQTVTFVIPAPVKHLNWILPVIVLVMLIIAVVLGLYYRYKRNLNLENLRLINSVNPDYDTNLTYEADEWEVDREDIEIQNDLGRGTFGTVFYGMMKSRNLPCAVKTINETLSLHHRLEFLNEASVMKAFHNCHHVVKLLGVVSIGSPPLVIMELMERGDLKDNLRRARESSQNITANEIYRMSIEIADGMAYLSSKKYVHRDLAARNCMVASDRTVKIGDFGMARDIYETDYYRKETKGLLPVRWMSPESLADGVFTSDSDIWSYGIVLWEIATLAEQPYQGLTNEQVLRFVKNRGKLDRPQECPDLLYDIMDACWNWRPNDRPTFSDVVERLVDHVGEDFKLVSFIHSREGLEYKLNHGGERAYNPPALSVPAQQHGLFEGGQFHVSEEEVNLYLGDANRPRYSAPTSLSQRLRRRLLNLFGRP